MATESEFNQKLTEVISNLGRIIELDINKDLKVSSKYEDRWKKQGKHIYDVVLECQQEDAPIVVDKDFSFDKAIDFDYIKQNIPKKAIVDEDFVVHIEDVFEIGNSGGLIQLTMGSFNRPVTKYIKIDQGNAVYFQGNPIATSANMKAHKKIKEILSND